jgi:hypothetical protein
MKQFTLAELVLAVVLVAVTAYFTRVGIDIYRRDFRAAEIAIPIVRAVTIGIAASVGALAYVRRRRKAQAMMRDNLPPRLQHEAEMTKETKEDREKRQAAAFLQGVLVYDHLECVKPDPPDVRVWRSSSPVLNLELTEYHADEKQVAKTMRWATGLWPKVDARRRTDVMLGDIYGFVVFSDQKLPSLTKREVDQFAGELVALAGQVARRLGVGDERKIHFLPRADAVSHPFVPPVLHLLPKEDWPTISEHIEAVTFRKLPLSTWERWMCPQTDAGFTNIDAAQFRRDLEKKDLKIREVFQDLQRFPPNVPLWLVIIADMTNDMTSHLFPTNDEDRTELIGAIRSAGYNFANSPFDAVWLYSDFCQLRLQLFPATGLET